MIAFRENAILDNFSICSWWIRQFSAPGGFSGPSYGRFMFLVFWGGKIHPKKNKNGDPPEADQDYQLVARCETGDRNRGRRLFQPFPHPGYYMPGHGPGPTAVELILRRRGQTP